MACWPAWRARPPSAPRRLFLLAWIASLAGLATAVSSQPAVPGRSVNEPAPLAGDRCLALLDAFDELEWEQLERREILLRELPSVREGGLAFCAVRVMAVPPERVWPVLRDCHRFDEFMPRVLEAEQRATPDGTPTCRMLTDMPIPLGDVESEVRMLFDDLEGRGHRRRYDLVRGDYHHNRGAWMVLPWPADREMSLVLQEADARAKSSVPAFVVRAARHRQLRVGWRALEARARDQAGTEPKP